MLHNYEAVQGYWKEIVVVISIIIAVKIAYEIRLAGRFISKVLSDDWFSAAHKYSKVLILVPSLLFRFGERRLNAARYIVELEILMPAGPSSPPTTSTTSPSRAAQNMTRKSSLNF